jgi:hypothetical protein
MKKSQIGEYTLMIINNARWSIREDGVAPEDAVDRALSMVDGASSLGPKIRRFILREFTRCECSAIFEDRCENYVSNEEGCDVRWIPPFLRGTAEAAGSREMALQSGMAETLCLHPDCMEFLEPDPWIDSD